MSKYFLLHFFLFSFFFFVFFSAGLGDSQDGYQYLAIARRMYYDHSFELPVEEFPDNNIHMNHTDHVNRYSPTGLGYSLALIPAVMIEDIFLRAANTQPLSAFPLQSDWPVVLFASMTNSFFGAFLVVILYLYLRSYGFLHRTAVFLSFLGVICTNLFVYTKHVFAHMMFTSFLTAAFYGIRMYSISNKKRWLIFAGMTFGVVILSYNQTFILPIPALVLYYLLTTFTSPSKNYFTELITNLKKKNFKNFSQKLTQILQKSFTDLLYVLAGVLPFWLLYAWFNTVRLGDPITAGYGEGLPVPTIPATYILFEGIWGILFSPGRSIFLYSPILLLLMFFWWKLEKKIVPEILSFSVLTVIYIVFFTILTGSATFMVWHGEFSWGNRYLIAFLPLLWLLISHIFIKLSKFQKIFVFMPLVLIGLTIEIIGVLLPYQIKRAGLPQDIYLTEDKEAPLTHFSYNEYPNFLPRISPVFIMSKTLAKRLVALPKVYDHGEYDLRLIDGFDGPYDLGWTVWRGVQPTTELTFKNTFTGVDTLSLYYRNHVSDATSSYSAQLTYTLNTVKLPTQTRIEPTQDLDTQIPIPKELLRENNTFRVDITFVGTPSATMKRKQVLFLRELKINGQSQNIATLDYPFISPISKSLYGTQYTYWGGSNTEPWDAWYMHAIIYEQTFDLWWLRPLHYWDLPKDFFASLFIINVLGIGYFGYKVGSSKS